MKPHMLEFQTIIEEYKISKNQYPKNISEIESAIKNNSIFYKKDWLINKITPCNLKSNLFIDEIKYYIFNQISFEKNINQKSIPCSIKYEIKNEIYKIMAYDQSGKLVLENKSPLVLSNIIF